MVVTKQFSVFQFSVNCRLLLMMMSWNSTLPQYLSCFVENSWNKFWSELWVSDVSVSWYLLGQQLAEVRVGAGPGCRWSQPWGTTSSHFRTAEREEINTNSEGRVMCDMITSTLSSVDNVTTLIGGSRKICWCLTPASLFWVDLRLFLASSFYILGAVWAAHGSSPALILIILANILGIFNPFPSV